MATADDYAAWIVKNADKRGTSDFETVAQAYKQAKAEEGGAPAAAPPPDRNRGQEMFEGALRGAAGIGNTLLTPVRAAANAVAPESGVTGYLNAMKSGAEDLDRQNADSNYYKGAKLGTELAMTYPVGGVLSKVAAKAVPALTTVAPNFLAALETGGMRGGNALTRAAGGAITGAATAGIIDPQDAWKGAVAGGVLPTAVKAAGVVGNSIGNLAANAIGGLTGVGPEPVKQAFKAGLRGATDFVDNMRGQVPLTDVLDAAKQGLANMRSEASNAYRSGMVPIKNDATVLNFGAIDQALADAANVANFKGQTTNEAAAGAVQKMRDIVENWKTLAPDQFHTPEGMDALKRALGGVLEGIGPKERTASLAAGKIYNAAKDTITQQAPAYANVMKAYETAATQFGEIERTLSLGDRAAKDTAMRKLQSLMRNNVQTNYGNRLSLANTLEDKGGVDLMPSIAGQAMNSLTPRSLVGQGLLGANALTMMANPSQALLLPLQSPRVMGEGAYAAGRLLGATGNGVRSVVSRVPAGNALMNYVNAGLPDDASELVYRLGPVLAASR